MVARNGTRRGGAVRSRSAFTLIEVLLVIGIIGLLAALSLVVGSKVLQGAKKNLTADAIRVLDASLGNYRAQEDGNPSAVVYAPFEQSLHESGDSRYDDQDEVPLIPVADGRWEEGGDIMVNSVGLFLAQAEKRGVSVAQGLDPRLIRVYTPKKDTFPELTTVFDAWDRPMRYVHPKFDGQIVNPDPRTQGTPGGYVDVADENNGYVYGRADAEWLLSAGSTGATTTSAFSIRRNAVQEGESLADIPLGERDGDGGLCPSGQAYFYSAGPDGDPSTIEDNVYTAVPGFLEF